MELKEFMLLAEIKRVIEDDYILDNFDVCLAEISHGVQIMARREEKFDFVIYISRECGDLKIIYESSFEAEDYNDKKNIKDCFLKELKEIEEREKKFGMSLLGPHRDDFKIKINDKDAKLYASQGQQRTAALAIKMAEVALIEEDTGEMPVLLLDDVLSELDTKRRKYVLNEIKNIQIIITCTDKDLFEDVSNVNLINVENIKIKR